MIGLPSSMEIPVNDCKKSVFEYIWSFNDNTALDISLLVVNCIVPSVGIVVYLIYLLFFTINRKEIIFSFILP